MYHSFAITKNNTVYSWGLNNFGATGVPSNAGEDDAFVLKPQIIHGLKGKNIVRIAGGGHHSIATTANGECYGWGRMDSAQLGLTDAEMDKIQHSTDTDTVIHDDNGRARILLEPTRISVISGRVVALAANSDHNFAITAEGHAYSWGFSANYQTGQGTDDDVETATQITNTATRVRHIVGATTGAQFGILVAEHKDL